MEQSGKNVRHSRELDLSGLFRENELEMSSIQKMIPQIDIVHLRGILMEESEKTAAI